MLALLIQSFSIIKTIQNIHIQKIEPWKNIYLKPKFVMKTWVMPKWTIINGTKEKALPSICIWRVSFHSLMVFPAPTHMTTNTFLPPLPHDHHVSLIFPIPAPCFITFSFHASKIFYNCSALKKSWMARDRVISFFFMHHRVSLMSLKWIELFDEFTFYSLERWDWKLALFFSGKRLTHFVNILER